MAKRTILFGSYANGVIEGLDDILNSDKYVSVLPRIDTAKYCLALLSLCGAKHFHITGADSAFKPLHGTIARRLGWRPYSRKEWSISKAVLNTFYRYLPSDFLDYDEEDFHAVMTLQYFIEDLMIGAQRGVSVTSLLPIPPREQLKRLIPQELFGPLSILLDRVYEVEFDGTLPKSELLREDVRRLRVLFESDEFSFLCGIHQSAKVVDNPLERLKLQVCEATSHVVNRFPDSASVRKVMVGTISATPDLIKEAFGGVAGALAKVGTKALTKLLQEDRRVLIYHLAPHLDELVDDRKKRYEKITGK